LSDEPVVEHEYCGSARVSDDGGEGRTLRERDRPRDAVFAQLGEAVLGQRPCVAERDVGLVRRRLGTELVEQLDHAGALLARPLEDRRPAADALVLLLDLRRPSPRDDRREIRLEG